MRPPRIEVEGNNIAVVVLSPLLRWRWANEGGARIDDHDLPPGRCLGRSRSRFVIIAPSDNGTAIVFIFVFVLAICVAAFIVSSWLDGGVPVNIIVKFTWRNRRLPSPTRINLEEPGQGGQPT